MTIFSINHISMNKKRHTIYSIGHLNPSRIFWKFTVEHANGMFENRSNQESSKNV
jgi:hypothetical protein